MFLEAIIYHPTYAKLVKFLDSTPKREKLFRLVVYLSRFLSYYLQRQGFPLGLVQKFKDLKGHTTFIRKGLRFLKPLNHFQAAAKAYDDKAGDSVFRITTVVRNLAYGAYLSLDSIIWFKMLGLLDKKKYQLIPMWCARFWLIGLVAGVVNSVRSYKINTAKLVDIEKAADVTAAKTKISAAKRKLVWDGLDIFICLNNLNYLHFSEGDIGLAGTITSIMGLRDLWAAT